MTESTATGQRPRVFCTWRFPEQGLRLLRERFEVTVWDEEFPAPAPVLHRELAAGAEGVFAMPPTDRLDAPTIAAAPRLRAIVGFGVGFDYVDVAAATERGILVMNTPGVLVETTAELAFGLMLAAARRIAEGDQYMRAGQWTRFMPELCLGRDLFGATLGIIGMGAIGQAVTRRATAFGMTVLYSSRSRKREAEGRWGARHVSLEEVLRQSDYVSVHCALTAETKGLIGARELSQMKPGAILISTARGPIVDQQALTVALRDGPLAAAGLDVYEQEPIAPEDPLLALPNVVMTPHIGSATIGTRAIMSEIGAQGLCDALEGRRPAHLVTPAAWRD